MITKINRQNNVRGRLTELYEYKQLISSFALRDLKVKFSNTYVGILWSIINPIISLVILVFVFTKITNSGTDKINPVVYTLSGLLIWNYFSETVQSSSMSIINSREIIQKIYFPKLVLPLSKIITSKIDFLVTLAMLIGAVCFYSAKISTNIIYFPLCLGLIFLLGMTGAIWTSALCARYRDFQYVIPVFLRLGMFITPIGYSSKIVPDTFRTVYELNPLVGTINCVRWSLFGIGEINYHTFFSIGILVAFLIAGIYYFFSIEKDIVDIL